VNAFLERLRGTDPILMLAIRSGRTTDVVRIAKATRHHAVMVDLEHSTMPLDVAASLCATAADLGLFPFARVPEREYGAIGRLLDGGAQGIIAPHVETAAEAAAVARACRFAPRGQRSQLATVPQFGLRPTPAATLNPALDEAVIAAILIADLEDTFVIDHMGYMTDHDPDFEERLLGVLRQGRHGGAA
jgi:2-keto-3-deoxy-L-rhamnonate aldolase RhmA